MLFKEYARYFLMEIVQINGLKCKKYFLVKSYFISFKFN